MPSSQITAFMDAAVDAVILIDHLGRIEALNRAGEQMFGWQDAEVRGRNVTLLMPEDEREAHGQHLARYLQTGEAQIIGAGRELEAQRRDGSRFPAHLSVGRIGASDPPRFVGFLRDITAEVEARRSRERLMHVSRMATVGEMASGIAHEVNQPLTAIANYARAAERFLSLPEPDLAESREALREIAAEALRAGGIIRRLRQLARGGDESRETVRLNEVIEELGLLARGDARAHDTRLRFELGEDLPPVCINRVQITQLLLNLIRNALEALTQEAQPEREIRVRSQRSATGDCEILVCDNGPGVSQDMLDRMFEPFRTTKANGTGLGLPMSQTIAQAHGGQVRYQPALPRGACFILSLPAAGARP